MNRSVFFLVLFVLASSLVAQDDRYLNPQGAPQITYDVQYGEAPDRAGMPQPLLLDVYEPSGPRSGLRPAVLWIHGGGFVSGTKELGPSADLSRELASRGYVCFSANYRLDPSMGANTQERAEADIAAAWGWIQRQAGRYGVDPSRFAIGGESAGAILSINTAYSPTLEGRVPAAVINIYGSLFHQRIGATKIPVLSIHGDRDQVINFGAATGFTRMLEQNGVPNQLFVMEGEGHNASGRYQEDVLLQTTAFLYRTIFSSDRERPRVAPGSITALPGEPVKLPFGEVRPPSGAKVWFALGQVAGSPARWDAFGVKVAAPRIDSVIEVPRHGSEIAIDGDLSDWGVPLFTMDRPEQVKQLPDWGGTTDLSARFWLAWDEDFLYWAAEVTQQRYRQTNPASELWREDSIQLALDTRSPEVARSLPGDDYTELGFARDSRTGANLVFRWLAPYSQDGEPPVAFASARGGDKTLYEGFIPWSSLDGTGAEGQRFQFSVLLNHLSARGFRGWMEYGSGIGASKDASEFVRAVLK